MDKATRCSWERLLHPGNLREALITAAVFVAAYELFEDSVIGRLKMFFSNGFDKNGPTVGSQYEEQVRSKHKNQLQAALVWHKEHEIISEDDVSRALRARKTRNRIAHELISWVTDQGPTDEIAQELGALLALLQKIEVWWIRNFEMAIQDDIDPSTVSDDDITPGPIIALTVLLETALGPPETRAQYYEAFKNLDGST